MNILIAYNKWLRVQSFEFFVQLTNEVKTILLHSLLTSFIIMILVPFINPMDYFHPNPLRFFVLWV
jgi:hypothetical protein